MKWIHTDLQALQSGHWMWVRWMDRWTDGLTEWNQYTPTTLLLITWLCIWGVFVASWCHMVTQNWVSMLTQLMADSLSAPSQYLNKCWLITSKVLWHSSEGIIIRWSADTHQWYNIENCIFKISPRHPQDRSVKMCDHHSTFVLVVLHIISYN